MFKKVILFQGLFHRRRGVSVQRRSSAELRQPGPVRHCHRVQRLDPLPVQQLPGMHGPVQQLPSMHGPVQQLPGMHGPNIYKDIKP
jgi:hypothetical protein